MEYINFERLTTLITDYTPKVIGAILVLLIGFWLAGVITRIVRRWMTRQQMDESIIPFLSSLISVGIKVLVLLSVAGMFGVETASFIAIFGALAFSIGLALQGSLGHFASGVMLLTFKPYKVGDLVELGGKVGVVEEIQIFNTVLLTPDNKKIIIPNGVVTSDVITNISGQGEIRVDMTFGIGYDDDIDKARSVIQSVVNSCPTVLHDRTTDILVNELADSSVNFTVRPWAKSEHYWDVFFHLNENIKKAMDKEGISIPYPQMDVHQVSHNQK